MTERPGAKRYPGIRSFERAEQQLFFGRSREVDQVYSLVKVKPLVVLFAKSGIGKTSLINAGLTPLLEKNGFLTLKIRLQDTSISPVDTVKKMLAPYLDVDLLQRYAPGGDASMWEYLRSCRFADTDGARTPVLVFDQFEELFEHPSERQESLVISLADLINERLPDAVQQRFRNYPRGERSEELLEWFSPLKIRVVFAIRTDRLGELDRLAPHIPTVLHDRFYLRPLHREAAREAIVLPAEMADATFACPPFRYTDEALAVMLDALDNEKDEVESFQLQLLCQHIENQIFSSKKTEVTPADFGGATGIDAILNDYYEREIGLLDTTDQVVARRFIEEGLIAGGRRVGVPEGAEQAHFGVSPGLLNRLLDSRIIRAEVIHLGKIYELSHDTLVAPVLRSYEQRRIEEERQQAERALAAERARLHELGKKRRRARLLAVAGFVLAGLALIGGFFALRNARQADAARRRADVSALAAKAWDVYRDDHTLAFRLAQAALQLDTSNAEAQQTLRAMVNIPTTTFYRSVFNGHRFEVTALAFSPNGELVASGSYDHSVKIWERGSGRQIAELPGDDGNGHNTTVCDLAFTADGQHVISAAEDGWVKIIALKGEKTGEFRTHRRAVRGLALAPAGNFLVTASNDSTAMLWTLEGQPVRTLRGHRGKLRAVAVAPDGRSILTGSEDGTARLWSAGSGAFLRTYDAGNAKVNAVAFAPDGGQVLLGCSDNTARLFTLDGRTLGSLGGHTAGVVKVAFTPDNRYLLTASSDHTVKMWTPAGEELLRLVGHAERISSLAVSPDGQWVVTGSFDFTAKIWNIPFNRQNRATRHEGPVYKVAVSPDGQQILSGGEDNTAKVWDWQGNLLFSLKGHRDWVTGVAFSPDGQRMLTCSRDATVRLWDAKGEPIRVLPIFKIDVNAAVFSPDGRWVAAASGAEVFVLDTAGKLLHHWKAHKGVIKSLEFDREGRRLLSTGTEGLTKIWTPDGQLRDSMVNDGKRMQYAAFAPDGRQVVTVAREYPVKIWDTTGQLIQTLYGHLDEPYHVVFSRDGQWFATCSWDYSTRLWHRDGRPGPVMRHPDGVYGAAFSPDGARLVTACRDKIIRTWDVATGRLLNTIGDRLDVTAFLRSDDIASLEQIPFSLERFGIAPATALQIFGQKPATLLALGQRYLSAGASHAYDYHLAFAELQNAETYLRQAGQLPGAATGGGDSLLAEVYAARAYVFLIHRQYPQMLAAAENGLKIKELPLLKVYQTFGLLFNGKFEQAKNEALELGRDTSTMVPPFYANYREAFLGEADFYRQQFGFDTPDLERFEALFGPPEE